MSLIVTHSDGTDFITIPDKTTDVISTSLDLPGKGITNWGQIYTQNFIKLLENFASNYEPRSPQVGQIWYNTATGKLCVYSYMRHWEVINKDTAIEQQLNTLFNQVNTNSAGSTPPLSPKMGQLWFDTEDKTLKIFDGIEWNGFELNSTSSYIRPQNPEESDLWFDKNTKELNVYDGSTFKTLQTSVEATIEPEITKIGQFWNNPITGSTYISKTNPTTGETYWEALGSTAATEGTSYPLTAPIGSIHKLNLATTSVLYINKGTQYSPVWVEIPEFGGALKSATEPQRVVDGMLWLDAENVLRIRKGSSWVSIDETSISYVSAAEPTNIKDGMLWFDTASGEMKIRIGNEWKSVQTKGLISYGIVPSSPKKGQLWYDDVNTSLKIFNGSVWESVNAQTVIVDYKEPTNISQGQLWLDTNQSELKVRKNGYWSAIPENARAKMYLPANPSAGDITYVDSKLKVYDGIKWNDVNISLDTSSLANDISINYDALSHELVITDETQVSRVPLGLRRDVIVENVGITSDVVEVIKPNITATERRIIEIQQVNLNRPFLLFKNGVFITNDQYVTDGSDLIIRNANGEDEITLLQFNGDFSLSYNIKNFKSTVNGIFVIDNNTLTTDEQIIFDTIKAEYDTQLATFLVNHGDNATIDDLTSTELTALEAIESKYPIKNSNNIEDLSNGSIMVFKEGVLIPTSDLIINQDNDNRIRISNAEKGIVYTICQLSVGNRSRSAFYSKAYQFVIGRDLIAEEIALNLEKNQKGRMIASDTSSSSATVGLGIITPNNTYNAATKIVEFDLLDIDPNYNILIFRNNLFVPSTHYEVDTANKKVRMYANNEDTIRIEQFYLPSTYVPVEFNYYEQEVKADGWLTVNLPSEFNIDKHFLVYRNGMLQRTDNYMLVTSEIETDASGISYTVSGLRKLKVLGDDVTNAESKSGVLAGDIITIMQPSQSSNFNVYLEEFFALTNGSNFITPFEINVTKELFIFKNGVKMSDDEYKIFAEDKTILVYNCNIPTTDELIENPNAKADVIQIYQFMPIDDNASNDTIYLLGETTTATTTGSELFDLNVIESVKDEFLLVYKNGVLLTRRSNDTSGSASTQINTYKSYIDRIYTTYYPKFYTDENGNLLPELDQNGNQVMDLDETKYVDKVRFSVDNVVPGEQIEIYEYNQRIVSMNNLFLNKHYEILPLNNIQRIYTTKFQQLSNLTMVFQDGILIDRTVENGMDRKRNGQQLVLNDQYAIDENTKSIIVHDWKVGGKLRVQQFSAQEQDVQTITYSVTVTEPYTYDIFLPSGDTYNPSTGALTVYVNRDIQWVNEDYMESANNKITFAKALTLGSIVKLIIRK